MEIEGWKYYNHAAIPTTVPHETPNMLPLEDGSIWKIDGKMPLLARWTADFDCPEETNWWYVIKDAPFDIANLKAKRRYEINKGTKNFNVVQIDPKVYAEELYRVQVAAFSAYPAKYRPTVDRERFLASVERWDKFVAFGAFNRETEQLCGYALLLKEGDSYADFAVLKADPQQERNGINAALVEGVLQYFKPFLENGGYICDGARSINHETAFQDYLEKYFGFRKAYCRLHMAYNPKYQWLISLLRSARKLLRKLDGVGIIHSVNAIFRMEDFCCNEETK